MSRPPTFNESKPYKGPDSYQVEDSDLFFGRDREADQLIAKILSARFTLLHAQSGAGKTSLLNARIIPGLESRGWSAIRILPQNDPVESVRTTTLRYILPPPQAELLAIARARAGLSNVDEDITLSEILTRYDNLKVRDPLRRSLIKPVEVSLAADSTHESGLFTPLFCRLLRSSIELDSFTEHLGIIQSVDVTASTQPINIGCDTLLSELTAILTAPKFQMAYQQILKELNIPVSDLSAFFESLVEVYGQQCSRFTLVLILDQFEEMFTRFVDPGPAATERSSELPDWRLRWEFFAQLGNLYQVGATTTGDLGTGGGKPVAMLPIRYVVSMRDEYIAQLDPIRKFVGTLDDSSYHLSLLEKKQAEVAIQHPAFLFGYTYSAECFTQIIQQLTKEDRFVEPAHLQLVCEKLWNERGRELALDESEDQRVTYPSGEIELDVFTNLGGTKGILKSFLHDFLEGLDHAERLETLEMLEPLVTASGTRNIIELERLIHAPFRDGSRRVELLNGLVNRTIVRTERRLGGYFVEITHEFLIAPILEALRNEISRNPDYSRFRLALRALERFQGVSFGGATRLLSPQEFLTLHENMKAIRWNDWGAELMFRSALYIGVDKSMLTVWWHAHETYTQSTDPALLFESKLMRKEDRTLLSLGELRLANNLRDSLNLSSEQVELILRSELIWAVDAEREDVLYWAKEIKAYAE